MAAMSQTNYAGECNEDYLQTIEELLKCELSCKSVTKLENNEGGIVNRAATYDTDKGRLFVKYADRSNAFDMFNAEHESLKAICRTNTVRVPESMKVIKHPQGGALHVLEYIPNLTRVDVKWRELGEKMARLHIHNHRLLECAEKNAGSIHVESADTPVTQFGFHTPIFLGPKFEAPTGWHDNWLDYYVQTFMEPQFREIEQRTREPQFREIWSELQLYLDKPFRSHDIKPALTHGDFCYINIGENAKEALTFDPGSNYGHYETDFTIPLMENNFDPEFFHGYHSIRPKEPGFDLRNKIYIMAAYALIYNVPGQEGIRVDAIRHGEELLELLKNS